MKSRLQFCFSFAELCDLIIRICIVISNTFFNIYWLIFLILNSNIDAHESRNREFSYLDGYDICVQNCNLIFDWKWDHSFELKPIQSRSQFCIGFAELCDLIISTCTVISDIICNIYWLIFIILISNIETCDFRNREISYLDWCDGNICV